MSEPVDRFFSLEVAGVNGHVRLGATGELDLATAGRTATTIREFFDRGHADVVVDLRELTFIDSSGIHALLECDRYARGRAGRLSVIIGAGVAARAIELCGVRDLLTIVGAGEG